MQDGQTSLRQGLDERKPEAYFRVPGLSDAERVAGFVSASC